MGALVLDVLTAGPAMDPKAKRTQAVTLPPELRHIYAVYDVNGNGTLDRIEVRESTVSLSHAHCCIAASMCRGQAW